MAETDARKAAGWKIEFRDGRGVSEMRSNPGFAIMADFRGDRGGSICFCQSGDCDIDVLDVSTMEHLGESMLKADDTTVPGLLERFWRLMEPS